MIAILELNGNRCEKWSGIKVHPDFDPENVRDCTFSGDVYIGANNSKVQTPWGKQTPMIIRSSISNCHIQGNCLISDVGILNNYLVEKDAVVCFCNTISSESGAFSGNGVILSLGVESGERDIPGFCEISLELITALAEESYDQNIKNEYGAFLEKYLSIIKSAGRNRICRNAVIISTPVIEDTFIGAYARIENALAIRNCTILSNRLETTIVRDGALVVNSALQWGSRVESMAIVEDSIIAEHAFVEKHGKVLFSYLGANSCVAEGEVTACLLGPFIGFHHQALLIAAMWPEGKGNIGYGANIGSNHTSRRPDQEIWCGEGTFFGLGCSIKFPANFRESPYLIIATGVTTLPQKTSFPFSLLNIPVRTPSGISHAYNEIIPGWVLRENFYSILRNMAKFNERDSSTRSKIEKEILRPNIINLMISARNRLREVSGKDVYLESDIPGLGKNFCTDNHRNQGIGTYTKYIGFYALEGLFREVESRVSIGADPKNILSDSIFSDRWKHELEIIKTEYPDTGLVSLLESLSLMWKEIATSVHRSKEKDGRRGRTCFWNYDKIHPNAESDPFVREIFHKAGAREIEISEILSKITD